MIMNADLIEERREQVRRLRLHADFLESGSPTLSDTILKELKAALDRTGGNRTHTAEQLGVSLRTVRNWINEYGLK